MPNGTTNPLAPGSGTSEYKATKFIIALTTIAGVLSTVLGYTEQAKALFGADSKIGLWIGLGSVALGAITSILYTVQRSAIKIAAIKAGQNPPADAAKSADAAAASLGT